MLGAVIGLFAPLLGIVIFYFMKASSSRFLDFLAFFLATPSLITVVVTVSMLINAALFTYYINSGIDRTARGIFGATCAWAIVAIVTKFFL